MGGRSMNLGCRKPVPTGSRRGRGTDFMFVQSHSGRCLPFNPISASLSTGRRISPGFDRYPDSARTRRFRLPLENVELLFTPPCQLRRMASREDFTPADFITELLRGDHPRSSRLQSRVVCPHFLSDVPDLSFAADVCRSTSRSCISPLPTSTAARWEPRSTAAAAQVAGMRIAQINPHMPPGRWEDSFIHVAN